MDLFTTRCGLSPRQTDTNSSICLPALEQSVARADSGPCPEIRIPMRWATGLWPMRFFLSSISSRGSLRQYALLRPHSLFSFLSLYFGAHLADASQAYRLYLLIVGSTVFLRLVEARICLATLSAQPDRVVAALCDSTGQRLRNAESGGCCLTAVRALPPSGCFQIHAFPDLRRRSAFLAQQRLATTDFGSPCLSAFPL